MTVAPLVRRWSGTVIFVLILLGSTAVQIRGAWEDSPTIDEPTHIVDGLAYWQLGSFEYNFAHPPLAKIGSGLAVYLAGVRIDAASDAWHKQDTLAVNQQVVFAGQDWQHVRWIVFIARLPVLLFWVLLISLVWWFCRRQWGDLAALAGTAIIAFDPSLLGHGHLVNTDVPVTAMFLATILATDAYFRRPRPRTLWILAAVFALAQLTKYSALILWPILLGVGIAFIFLRRPQYTWRMWWQMCGALIGASLVIGLAVYQFEGVRPNTTSFPHWTISVANHDLWLPTPSYWRGVYYTLLHNTIGHRTIFAGQVEVNGNPLYFPTALAVKTPITTIVVWSLGLLTLTWAWFRKKIRPSSRWLLFWTAGVFFGAVALMSHLNIGLRYIFPLVPLLALVVAGAVHEIEKRSMAVAVVMTAIAFIAAPVSLAAYPHTIGYFNGLAGGTAHGARWFIDSNLDWGQDDWRVKEYLDRQPAMPTDLSLFSNTPLSLFGSDLTTVPNDTQVLSRNPSRRVIISDALLEAPDRGYQWILSLDSLHETARIGSAVHVLLF